MNKMNVLFIGSTCNIGGAPKSMIELIKPLKNYTNVKPIVITSISDGILNKFCEDNNITYYVVDYVDDCVTINKNIIKNMIKFFLLPFLRLRHDYKELKCLKKIDNIIKQHNINLIHTNINRVTLGCKIKKKYGIPHIMHIREFGKEDYHTIYYHLNIQKYYNKYCDYYIAISNSVKEAWTKMGIDKNKIKTIYNGFTINEINTKNISYKEGINAIFMGGITPEKGQIQLLEAIAILPDDIKKKFHVNFYGKCGVSYKKELNAIIRKNNIQENITFNEYDKNIDKKLFDYNLGFVCSKKEGFGRVTVEYMLNNVLVIASNTGANPEIIKSNKNGFIYKYNDINDLKDRIIEVYNCKHINKTVNQARLDAINNYSSTKISKEVSDLYEQLIK